MNKKQMIEEIIREHPNNLLLDVLWQDISIIKRVKAKLQAISEINLIPYHNQFVNHPTKEYKRIVKHIPLFKKGCKTNEYFKTIHEVI